MVNNKFVIGCLIIIGGVIGLIRMMLGYTNPSFVRVAFFVVGIVTVSITLYKQKGKHQYFK